jgi:beta-xylosidase
MYCMVYSARMLNGRQLALAAATQPQGPYHDLHAPWLDLGDGSKNGFVFVDGGTPFLVFSRTGVQPGAAGGSVYGVALNRDLSKTMGAPRKLLQADQRWELADQGLPRAIESPRIFKIGSKYYLTYTASDPRNSESAIGYATADKPMGPWTKSPNNPLLASRTETGLVRPANGSVFRSRDAKEWFFIYQTMGQLAGASQEAEINIDRLALLGIRQLSVQPSARRRSQPIPAGK